MILKVVIGEQTIPIEVPDDMVEEGEAFFQKMDKDMDKGWQMSRDWVDNPNTLQRCQIVADKLLTAIHNNKGPTKGLMAAYIVKRMPGVESVIVDIDGDINNTEVIVRSDNKKLV